MKIGNEDVKLYLGDSEVEKIYLGTEQVYSGGSEPTPPHDYSQDYLTIESLEDDNTVYLFTEHSNLVKTISASTDNGQTWSAYTSSTGGSGTTIATLDTGEKVLLKGLNASYGRRTQTVILGNIIKTTGSFNVYGNIMSMISGDSFSNADTLASSAFVKFFYGCSGMTSAENLILPATTLADYCYESMFRNCANITTPPELPATTLAQYCYNGMFNGCTSLNYIKCLATDISATDCTYFWVNGVASTGTFVKAESMLDWTTGTSGIPNGWTVQNDD